MLIFILDLIGLIICLLYFFVDLYLNEIDWGMFMLFLGILWFGGYAWIDWCFYKSKP